MTHVPSRNTRDYPVLLTAEQVGVIFRVGPRQVMRWAREGRLPSVRIPSGRRRFAEDKVLALIGAGRQERST